MESCWWIVPFGDLDRAGFVADVDDVEAVSATIRIVVIRNRVKFAIGQFVINQHPVIVWSDLDVDDSSNLGVVGGEEADIVWF